MKNSIFHLHKTFLLLTVLIAFALAIPTLAASLPPDQSRLGSGTALEGVNPPDIQPAAGKTPDITIEDNQPATAADDHQKILINAFRIGGEPPVPAKELQQLIQNEAGKELSLANLNQIAARITKYLRQQGYLVAFAYIPPQTIEDGVAEIAVVPGKYGQVRLSGNAHFEQSRLAAMLFAIKPGMVITRGPLERALLLMNDLSGISVKATITPGTAAGTADIMVEAADTDKMNGAIYADNWGNRYTGRGRYGAQIIVNNLSGRGDDFNLGGLTTGQDLNNYNLAYSVPLGYNGLKFEIKHTHVGYTLGEEFAGLGATGEASITSYTICYPFIRSRAGNLYGTLGYDTKHLHDDIGAYDTYSPKQSDLWNIGLAGNFADKWLSGGTNAFTLTHYCGKLTFDNATALAIDANYANTAGTFAKTLLTYQRQQYIRPNLNFNLTFIGQITDKNLDSSEKLFLGGADGVRAYPQGEGAGDQGYKLTGELRWRLSHTAKNDLYLNTFYDYGSVMVNKEPWPGAGVNRRSLMGIGLGLLWVKDKDFAVRMDYAWKLGEESATSDTDKNGRFWIQGVKYY